MKWELPRSIWHGIQGAQILFESRLDLAPMKGCTKGIGLDSVAAVFRCFVKETAILWRDRCRWCVMGILVHVWWMPQWKFCWQTGKPWAPNSGVPIQLQIWCCRFPGSKFSLFPKRNEHVAPWALNSSAPTQLQVWNQRFWRFDCSSEETCAKTVTTLLHCHGQPGYINRTGRNHPWGASWHPNQATIASK